jgi:hypothetical protein
MLLMRFKDLSLAAGLGGLSVTIGLASALLWLGSDGDVLVI